VVLVVFTLARSEPQLGQQRRAGAVQTRVRVQRSLIDPAFEQRQAGFATLWKISNCSRKLPPVLLRRLRAASLVGLGQPGALSRNCADRDNESNRHGAIPVQSSDRISVGANLTRFLRAQTRTPPPGTPEQSMLQQPW